MVKQILFSLAILLCIGGCQKPPEVFNAPTDPTIEKTVINNYVFKLYFSLLGREPSDIEAKAAIESLTQSNMAVEARREIISNIQHSSAYYKKLASEARNEYLNGLTNADIDKKNREIYGWMFNGLVDSTFSEELLEGINNYNALNLVPSQLEDGTITIADMHRRCVNNYTYSEINMGTDNFIKSCFLNFLFRYPTEYELEQATAMIGGHEGILFMKKAQGRSGFLTLFFNSDNYHEGLITNLYRKYLLRIPEPIEMAKHLAEYAKHNSFYKLQENILASDEYAGLVKHKPSSENS